ncbi:hypothetical protein BHM03_00031897 [Ensete ventricosum]|nr:hypothetical protein BHM03_00031897 [Ensete ventricosum]
MGVYKLIKSDDRVAAAPSAEPNKLVLAVVDDVLLSPHRDIEAGTKHSHEAPPEKEASAAGKRGPRLLSLDVFRGLTVAGWEVGAHKRNLVRVKRPAPFSCVALNPLLPFRVHDPLVSAPILFAVQLRCNNDEEEARNLLCRLLSCRFDLPTHISRFPSGVNRRFDRSRSISASQPLPHLRRRVPP